jgi:protein-disulfide isomerase
MMRLVVIFLLAGTSLTAQTPPPARAEASAPSELQRRVEGYLRDLFAWGPAYTIRIGNPTQSALPGFFQVGVQVSVGGQTDTGVVYVSQDGRYLIRGDVFDTSARPFESVRAQIRTDGHPSAGPDDAQVVFVEFSDFQCPHCRELARILRELKAKYPQVKFVHKDFPLTQIHPWAMTAAIAGRCAYQQDPKAFWRIYDAIFDNQERILPENAWNLMLEFAAAAGLDAGAFRLCMASPETKKTVEAGLEEGRALRIANTPTVFINGRRHVGGDKNQIQQFLDYELYRAGVAAPAKP